MLGRLRPKLSQLTASEQQEYKAGYCGLCQSLRQESGRLSTLTLSYDLTFLAHLEVAHHGASEPTKSLACTAVPWRKVNSLTIPPKIGALGLVLAGLKLEDDRRDERSVKARLGLYFLQPKVAQALKVLESTDFPISAIRYYSDHQFQVEQRLLRAGASNRAEQLRAAAAPSGHFTEAVFDWLAQGWSLQPAEVPNWRNFGKLLGEAVYIVDALEDRDQDARSGSFNPLSALSTGELEGLQTGLDSQARSLLNLWSKLPMRGAAWPALTSSLEQLSRRLSPVRSDQHKTDGRLQSVRKRRLKAAYTDCDVDDGCDCVEMIGAALSGLCWFAGTSHREREMERVHGDLLQEPGQGAPPKELERMPPFLPGNHACPSCDTKPMNRHVIGGAGLFHCSKCSGVWLNGAHLPELRKHKEARDFNTFPQESSPPVHPPGARVCPSDGATLELSRVQGVTVEECPTCQGWYLDAGELGSLL